MEAISSNLSWRAQNVIAYFNGQRGAVQLVGSSPSALSV